MRDPSHCSRGDAIAAALRDDILRGRHRPGDRLPAERELADQLATSRSSVREAFQRLEQLGLVGIRPGDGVRVRPLEEASLPVVSHLLRLEPQPDIDLVGQLLDVHEALVVASVRLAVEHATPQEVARAQRLLTDLGDPGLGDAEYFETAVELVQLIETASRNLVLRLVRNAFRSTFQARPGPLRMRLRPEPEVVEPIARGIVRALDERDAEAAERGVRRLLRANRELFLKRLEARGATARPAEESSPPATGGRPAPGADA